MITFKDLGLSEPLLNALSAKGYVTPTPIQAKAIPSAMEGRDLLGVAQTGTGKTAAFALPILHRLAKNPKPAPRRGCRVLVLSPTRELATQIAESFRAYGQKQQVRVATVFGGAKMSTQIKALMGGVDVLVATPGRLIDHLGQRTAQLGDTEIFVLDEADQMLDLGFFRPIRQIVSHIPKERQNMFFSATMPTEIAKLAAELLTDPVRIEVTPQATTVERVDQRVIFIEAGKKRALLAEQFDDPAFSRAIVFTRTKHGADRVAEYLEKVGIEAAAIHGDKRQGQRERALADFKAGKVRALVATDIAARGIDVDAVSHVVNYELPMTPEAYVHRIGRTARAGAGGSAISFCADDERLLLRAIQKTTRQTLPAFDRRGDKSLVVPAVLTKSDGGDVEQRVAQPKARNGGGGGYRDRDRRPEGQGRGRDYAPRDHAPRDFAPRDHAPPDHAPRDHAPRDHAPRDHAPRDHAPRDFAPRDHAPRDHAPRDHAPRDHAPRDHAPREHAARDHAPRDRAPRDFAPRDGAPRDHAPRDHAPRGHGPRDHAPREHASRDHAPREHSSRDHAPRDHGPRPIVPRGPATDAIRPTAAPVKAKGPGGRPQGPGGRRPFKRSAG